MSLKPVTVRLLAATALLAAGLPTAHATATATASSTPITWTLTDLDLTDGITPSFLTVTMGSYSQSYASAAASVNGVSQSLPGNYVATTASSTSAYGSASAGTLSTGAQATAQIKGSVVAGTQISSTAQASPFFVNFTLSPHTLIILSMQANLSSATTVGYNGVNQESSQAYSSIYASTTDNATYQSTRSVNASYLYISPGVYTGQTATNNGTVQLSFANTSNVPLTGYVQSYSYAYASSSIAAAVPENGALPLMGAGLCALALLVRRRRATRR